MLVNLNISPTGDLTYADGVLLMQLDFSTSWLELST